MKRLLLLLLLISIEAPAQFPSLSENSEISVITIGPGDQLYDKFGHTAIRVTDSVSNLDIAFNYGVYDFNIPNFYTKFARGKLNYMVVAERFEPFFQRYVREDRSVKEQVLNLTYSEKRAIYNYLVTNVKPENREYLYDFFYDNCATKPRDVISESLGETLEYSDAFVESPSTFRQLIQQNLHWNTWGSAGIDVALGAVIDRNATAWEHQFLPQFVFEALSVAQLDRNNGKIPVVKTSKILNEGSDRTPSSNFFTSPFLVFLILALLIIGVTYRDFSQNKRSRFLDGTLFFVTGIIGVNLAFLWFATDHTATANNYNLLWAFPINILICYAISKKYPKVWVSRYVFFLLLLLALLTFHWVSGVQSFAPAFIPLFIALAIRYLYVFKFLKNHAPKEIVS